MKFVTKWGKINNFLQYFIIFLSEKDLFFLPSIEYLFKVLNIFSNFGKFHYKEIRNKEVMSF